MSETIKRDSQEVEKKHSVTLDTDVALELHLDSIADQKTVDMIAHYAL